MKTRVLIIDDDMEFASLLAAALQKTFGVSVTLAATAYGAMNELLDSSYDMVVLDWNLDGFNGGKALNRVDEAMGLENRLPLMKVGSKIPVVLLSAYDSDSIRPLNREKKHFQVRSVLSKQHTIAELCQAMSRLFEDKMKSAG